MSDMLATMVEVFKTLGDPKRLRIIRLLASDMEPRLCVNDLAAKLGISQPAASQHLKALKNVGILYTRKEGYRVYYHIDTEVLRDIKSKIDVLFRMAFMKCPEDGNCADCPRAEECQEFQK